LLAGWQQGGWQGWPAGGLFAFLQSLAMGGVGVAPTVAATSVGGVGELAFLKPYRRALVEKGVCQVNGRLYVNQTHHSALDDFSKGLCMMCLDTGTGVVHMAAPKIQSS
jgi:hypothetical protein